MPLPRAPVARVQAQARDGTGRALRKGGNNKPEETNVTAQL